MGQQLRNLQAESSSAQCPQGIYSRLNSYFSPGCHRQMNIRVTLKAQLGHLASCAREVLFLLFFPSPHTHPCWHASLSLANSYWSFLSQSRGNFFQKTLTGPPNFLPFGTPEFLVISIFGGQFHGDRIMSNVFNAISVTPGLWHNRF